MKKFQGVYEGETKTGSMRSIRLAPQSLKLLRKWKTEQLRMKLAQGDRWVDSGYIFTQDDGSRLHPDSITDWLGKLSKKRNLPHIHPHAFHHTAASTMIANGVDLVTTANKLGHANASTTASICAHQIAIAKAKAADVRAGVFAGRSAKPKEKKHDVTKPKNPIILQASILSRKAEGKSSKKFGFFLLQKTGVGREPQNCKC